MNLLTVVAAVVLALSPGCTATDTPRSGLSVHAPNHGQGAGMCMAVSARPSAPAPTRVVLDRQGVIHWVHEGSVDQEVLRRAVLAVLGEGGRDE